MRPRRESRAATGAWTAASEVKTVSLWHGPNCPPAGVALSWPVQSDAAEAMAVCVCSAEAPGEEPDGDMQDAHVE